MPPTHRDRFIRLKVQLIRPSRSPVPLLIAALALVTLGCREDAPSPTAPESTPALAAALGQPLSFRQVSASSGHSCGVTTGDRAYCWGYNFFGQLGDGRTTDRSTPVAVLGGLRFRQVSASFTHTCGLTTDDLAYCWGSNSSGRLGDGTTTQRRTPVAVGGGRRFRQLSVGGDHTCAVTPSNRIFCWGENTSGQLGEGTTRNRLTPVRVEAGDLLFRQVSGGDSHTCGVTTDSRVYCWGANEDGQLGDGTKIQRLLPVPVRGGLNFRQASAGRRHTCGVTTADRAYCWGYNVLRQLGDGSDATRQLRPKAVLGGLRFDAVGAGFGHSCGLTTTNLAYCWGSNGSGEVGDGTRDLRPTPVAVNGGHRFHDLEAGGGHNCGVTTTSRAYCWGDNFSGQLGNGRSGVGERSLTPVPVAGAM